MNYLWILLLVGFPHLTSAGFGGIVSVTIQETDLRVRLDSTLNITCVVSIRQPLTDVSWIFNHYDGITEVNINKSSRYDVDETQADKFSMTSVLKVLSVTYDDEGRYTCRYRNTFDSIDIIVQGQPVITKPTSTVNAILKNDVTLTCEAQVRSYRVGDSANVVWLNRSGVQLDTDPFKYSISNTQNALHPDFESRLTVYDVTQGDISSYLCKVWNKLGSAQCLVKVTANPVLKIIEPQENRITLTLFDTITLRCRLSNIEEIKSVRWYFGKQAVSEEFGIKQPRYYTEDRGVTILELFLVKLSLEDEGAFSCRWKQLYDQRYLHVIGSLGIQAARNEIVTTRDSQISLECSVQSRPISTIQWYFKNEKLTSNTTYQIESRTESDISVRSILTVNTVLLEHFNDVFLCESSNSMSETSTDRIRLTAMSSSTHTTTKTPPPSPAASGQTLAMGLGIGLGLLGLFALVLIIVCCLCRRGRSKEQKLINVVRSTGEYNPTFDVMSEEVHVYSELTQESWEFPRNRLRFLNLLGEGKFGKVLKAEAMDIRGLKQWDEVAVKMVKESATDAEKQDFYQELLIVRKIPQHINVVHFLGCCTVGEPTLIIMEYVSGTDLLTYIRKCRPGRDLIDAQANVITQKDLLSFAFQTARGLRHLENNKIVHRDVAARNVLVDKGREKVCKISDFGLARDIEGADIYERTSKGPLPIRWMAPECMRDTVHTHKSDVWAYGVLLWEIVTLGSSPYPGLSGKQVMEYVLEGKTQQSPPHCNTRLSKVMESCWQFTDRNRPSFGEIVEMLEGILEEEGDYIKLQHMDEALYCILEDIHTEEKL